MRASAKVKIINKIIATSRPAWARTEIIDVFRDEFKENKDFHIFDAVRKLVDKADDQYYQIMSKESWFPFFDSGRHGKKGEFFKKVLEIIYSANVKDNRIISYLFFYAAVSKTATYGGLGNSESGGSYQKKFIDVGALFRDGSFFIEEFLQNNKKMLLPLLASESQSSTIDKTEHSPSQ